MGWIKNELKRANDTQHFVATDSERVKKPDFDDLVDELARGKTRNVPAT